MNGGVELKARSHEPREEPPHVRDAIGSRKWADISSDSEGEEDLCRALCMAYAPLDRASENVNTGRAIQIGSMEFERTV